MSQPWSNSRRRSVLFISSSRALPRSAWSAVPILHCCVLSLRVCASDRTAHRNQVLARRRGDRYAAGFDGLSAKVQTVLNEQPFSGHVFVFRGRRGDIVKLLWWDGDGLCLFSKRLERGRFIWPKAESGTVSLSRAQLSMLLEGIDWETA